VPLFLAWCHALTLFVVFSSNDLKQLGQTNFVPIKPEAKEGKLRYLPPSQCFFGSETSAQFHSKFFVFIDFGAVANGFLSACGTKQEPSVEEIAQMLLNDPHNFYQLAEGREK
jgi:hypothetical protein